MSLASRCGRSYDAFASRRTAVVATVLVLAARLGTLPSAAQTQPPRSQSQQTQSQQTHADEQSAGSEFERSGSDHVGQAYPEYLTGDECLFCHRKIGATWAKNAHQLTMRRAIEDEASVRRLRESATSHSNERLDYLIGYRRATRFFRRSTEYGKLEMAPLIWHAQADRLAKTEGPKWDAARFGRRCAGCHTTAVDAKTDAFSAVALDCVVCHGAVDIKHADQKSTKVWLAEGNQPAKHVVSICGQCHLRGGVSQSTGRPYPNTFVPGDNLFRDFRCNLSSPEVVSSHPRQRHIYESVQRVTQGRDDAHCLTCHDVHSNSTEKHQSLSFSQSCQTCHVGQGVAEGLVDEYDSFVPATFDRTICEWVLPAEPKKEQP